MDYIHLRLKADNSEPNNAEVKAILNLQEKPDATQCDWVDIAALEDADKIVVDDPLEWFVIMRPKKRICISFNDYVIMLYECLFTLIV